ncbi:uncharacterized protein LOC143857339 isoform X3 [Tasmannia lanceolata]|uniref:uncharacterized protein LOC143857339 isoform X3 n=1 Tax=Tasmannia lanceolata TaxID=3420 RepID=UPI004063B748
MSPPSSGVGLVPTDTRNDPLTTCIRMSPPPSGVGLVPTDTRKDRLTTCISDCGYTHRWHFKMSSIVEGFVLIMSRVGSGLNMFSMGLFMALQEKLIVCGANITLFSLVLRFIAGPATVAIGAIAMGFNGTILRVAVIQPPLSPIPLSPPPLLAAIPAGKKKKKKKKKGVRTESKCSCF